MTPSKNTSWNLDRHLHRWNAEEQSQLEHMFRSGADFVTIAQELHRTEYAIIGRLKDKKLIYWDKETESYKKK